MTRYLLDANVIITMAKDFNSNAFMKASSYDAGDIGVSSIVAHELYFGAFKSQKREASLKLVDGLLFEVLEFDKEDARMAGKIRAALHASGTPIGPLDVLIAGQALARDLILVTHNTREFSRVQGLQIEDWQS